MIPFVYKFEDIFDLVAADILTDLSKVIYYDYGHPLEIVNTLAEKTNNSDWKAKKYPLIMLFQDFKEYSHKDYEYEIKHLTIMIVTYTDPSFKAKDRYANTIVPTLYPIYESLLKHLETSTLIDWDGSKEKIDHVNWGKEGIFGSTANIFNDYLDAIQIDLKDIKVIKKC